MLPEWTVVGFSGHRKLSDPKVVSDAIRKVFDRLAANHSPLASVSSAANGADTLFVEEVARRNLPCLLVLPFSKNRFQQDFSPADWQRILPLIEKATHVEEVAGEESKEGAYMEAGILTADRADVMIVVWDGKPAAGFGGTGDVVNYARKFEKPLFIIDPATGKISEERLGQLRVKSPPTDWKDNPRETVEKYFRELDEAAELHAPKSRHLILRIILFQLAASAVGLTALTFDKEIPNIINPFITLAELALLGIAFVSSLQHRKKSDEWMKNRIKAEICRSFLAMWNMRRRAEHVPKLSIQGLNRLCRNLRLIRVLDKGPSLSLELARDQYLKERVEDQIKFFSRKGGLAQAAYRKFKFYTLASTAVATLCSLLALWIHPSPTLTSPLLHIPKYLSLLLPLFSTAFFLLIVTQDYSRRAVRYAEMASILKDAKKRLEEVKTWNSLARIATETEEELLQEVVEWHSFRQFAGEPN
jgi:hypothetical protein